MSKVPYITLTGGSGGPYYSYYGAGGGGVMINGEGPTSTTYGRGQVIILILLHSWVLRMNTIVLENTDSFPGLRCGWRQLLLRLQWTLGSGDHIHWQWRGGWQR